MSIQQSIYAGLAGEKLSRTITGTNDVSAGRSVVATGSGALVGGLTTGAVAIGASAVGVSALATVAAPLVIPVALAAGAVSFIRSLWD